MKLNSTGQVVLILVAVAYLLGVYFISSPVWMGFTINALIVAVLALSWNVTGGFGGLSSFGHAVLYGTGAYTSAILQVTYGVNAWVALVAGIAMAAAVGGFIGALAFRYGVKGSYFALVTLAFAEVFRICAASFDFTGGGSGLQLKLAPGISNIQFADRTVLYTFLLAIVVLVMLLTAWIKYSRFGPIWSRCAKTRMQRAHSASTPTGSRFSPWPCRAHSGVSPACSICNYGSSSIAPSLTGLPYRSRP